MTTIVPTSEEDPSLAIVRFTSQLAWADAGPEVPPCFSIIDNHCANREFRQKERQSLRTKLAAWRENIANVISSIEASKATEVGTQASSSSSSATLRD